MTVFGFLPAFIFYTESLPAPWCGGTANGPVVRLRPKYQNDTGILAHELVHVRQWYRTLGLHGILYTASRRYRLASEVEAYREQLRHYNDDRSVQFADSISACYQLDITQEQALTALLG
jgi:hypothetical protein